MSAEDWWVLALSLFFLTALVFGSLSQYRWRKRLSQMSRARRKKILRKEFRREIKRRGPPENWD